MGPLLVEARTVGADDWTTLRDLDGHNSQSTGASCPSWLALHPFLAHYETDNGDGSCSASRTTGEWWASSGVNTGPERWTVDLSGFAGKQVEVHDIAVSTGEGSTSFEDDGNVMDGWTVPGARPGSPANENDWIVGGRGRRAGAAGRHRPRVVRQPAAHPAVPLPRRSPRRAGSSTSATSGSRSRRRRARCTRRGSSARRSRATRSSSTRTPTSGRGLPVAARLGKHLAQRALRDLRGVALERPGGPRHRAGAVRRPGGGHPRRRPVLELTIGDPGPDRIFDDRIYDRGAMTLQAVRRWLGDRRFFRVMRLWVRSHAGGTVTTGEFIRLAERVTGEDLGDLFRTWLFTPAKPAGIGPAAAASAATAVRASAPALRGPLRRP